MSDKDSTPNAEAPNTDAESPVAVANELNGSFDVHTAGKCDFSANGDTYKVSVFIERNSNVSVVCTVVELLREFGYDVDDVSRVPGNGNLRVHATAEV
jgi:hypothetical protein